MAPAAPFDGRFMRRPGMRRRAIQHAVGNTASWPWKEEGGAHKRAQAPRNLLNLAASWKSVPMIDKLEFLIALSREHHFGRAALLCGVTQPTLSAGIKQLEGELGVLLVARGSRFQGFTPDGERVLDWARRIVGDARAMRQDVEALKRGLSGHLRIAAIPTALAMSAMLTTPYRARHREVRFTILSRTSIQVSSGKNPFESLSVSSIAKCSSRPILPFMASLPFRQRSYAERAQKKKPPGGAAF
jgi:hypothetical protein